MNRPNLIPNCPPGLEYLTMIDTLRCEQLVDFIEGLEFKAGNSFF